MMDSIPITRKVMALPDEVESVSVSPNKRLPTAHIIAKAAEQSAKAAEHTPQRLVSAMEDALELRAQAYNAEAVQGMSLLKAAATFTDGSSETTAALSTSASVGSLEELLTAPPISDAAASAQHTGGASAVSAISSAASGSGLGGGSGGGSAIGGSSVATTTSSSHRSSASGRSVPIAIIFSRNFAAVAAAAADSGAPLQRTPLLQQQLQQQRMAAAKIGGDAEWQLGAESRARVLADYDARTAQRAWQARFWHAVSGGGCTC
jgi:hypothetical protein